MPSSCHRAARGVQYCALMPGFQEPIWQIVLRASAVYVALAATLRFLPKRTTGSVSPNDFIALVIIGGLVADGIAVGADSTPDLLLMVATVLLWDYIFNLLEQHFPRFRRVTQDSPTLLIHNGRVLKDNLRKEMMTEEELAQNLRGRGLLDASEVKLAVLEPDGQVSIIKRDDDSD